jgi:hypothetical protein
MQVGNGETHRAAGGPGRRAVGGWRLGGSEICPPYPSERGSEDPFIRDVLVGRSSNPGIYSLEKVCAELKCTLVQLLVEAGFGRGGPLLDEKLRTARFKACAGLVGAIDLEDAAKDLKVPAAVLEALAVRRNLGRARPYREGVGSDRGSGPLDIGGTVGGRPAGHGGSSGELRLALVQL